MSLLHCAAVARVALREQAAGRRLATTHSFDVARRERLPRARRASRIFVRRTSVANRDYWWGTFFTKGLAEYSRACKGTIRNGCRAAGMIG